MNNERRHEHRTYGPAVPEAGLARDEYVSPFDTIEPYFDFWKGDREFRRSMSAELYRQIGRMIPEPNTLPD